MSILSIVNISYNSETRYIKLRLYFYNSNASPLVVVEDFIEILNIFKYKAPDTRNNLFSIIVYF